MTIEKLVTPTGRIVWGNPAKPQIKKDQKTKQPIIKDGKEVQQWAFGVAFSKQDFIQHIWPFMQQEALSAYPNGVPSNFSWKYKDGDGVDSNGQLYSTREGYAGCYILNVSTEAFAPPIFKYENGAYRQMAPEEVKCGHYVSLNLNMKVNVPTDRQHTPGLYINPNGIEHVAYGAEIVSVNADPNEMFGGRQHAIPQGASAVPLSSAPAGVAMPMGGMPPAAPMAQPMQQPMMAPQPQYAPQPAAQPMQPQYAPQAAPAAPLPAPAHDFVRNAGMPQQMGGQPPMAQPMQPQPMGMPQMGNGAPSAAYPAPQPTAVPATTYPGNIPGMPPSR